MTTAGAIWERQLAESERRGEYLSSFIMAGLLFAGLAFLFFQTSGGDLEDYDRNGIQALQAVMLGAMFLFLSIVAGVRKGFCPPWLKFVSSTLQLSLASTLLVVDLEFAFRDSGIYGPAAVPFYSPAVLLLYGLAIALTAFRLSPGLTLFAFFVAAIQFAVVNEFWMRPLVRDRLPPPLSELLYGWNFVLIVWLVMGSIGMAAAASARGLLHLLDRSVREAMEADRTEKTFGRYVSREVAKRALSASGPEPPRVRRVAVIFADLVEFTAYSEGVEPAHSFDVLNSAWALAADCVQRHGGVIDKFLGDGFMAVFGAPSPLDNPESAACGSAKEIWTAVGGFLFREGLQLRMGLHAGDALAGELGSGERCEYTVLGAAVNTTARIEQANKQTGTWVLASEEISSRADPSHNFRFVTEMMLRGQNRPIRLLTPSWAVYPCSGSAP